MRSVSADHGGSMRPSASQPVTPAGDDRSGTRNRKAQTALGAAAVDHGATVLGRHAGAKAMGAHAAGIAGIAESFLHGTFSWRSLVGLRTRTGGESLHQNRSFCVGKVVPAAPGPPVGGSAPSQPCRSQVYFRFGGAHSIRSRLPPLGRSGGLSLGNHSRSSLSTRGSVFLRPRVVLA